MRKALITLILFQVVPAQAQITLTAATSNPLPGDTATFYAVEGYSLYPGDSGAAVTWDYSTLTPADKKTRYYHIPGTVCDPYPSQLAATGAGSCDYYQANNDSFSMSCSFVPGAFYRYKDDKLVLKYPLTYNAQVYIDSFYRRDSLQSWGWIVVGSHGGSQQISSDAYGTLILPDSAYTNVLRVKKHIYFVSQYYYQSGNSYTDMEVYEWYSADLRSFLLQVTNMIHDGLMVSKPAAPEVNIYPNPASGKFRIELDSAPMHIYLKDITGKKMQEITAVKGEQKYNMDVSRLAAGIYFLEVGTTQGILIRKIQVL